MAYLHNDRIAFADAIHFASNEFGILPTVVEKDYYVTMILLLLAQKLSFVVFKGGTSLSKCHKVIKRFSEDIDITIDTKLSQSQMGHLKDTIVEISQELGMRIPNLGETRSRRSYNKYLLEYDPVTDLMDTAVPSTVILETSFAEVSFPAVFLPVHSYIGDVLTAKAPDALEQFMLKPFDMKVQGIDRTLIDKVFAICDYYLKGQTTRHSRHVYDIYKINPLVPKTEQFRELVKTVREVRAKNEALCPSAMPDISIPAILNEVLSKEVYKRDYNDITLRILEEEIPYDVAKQAINDIIKEGMFNDKEG